MKTKSRKKINEHGVFNDPEVIYEKELENVSHRISTWAGSYRGKWFYGYWMPSTVSPCSIYGRSYPDRESAIRAARAEILDSFTSVKESGIISVSDANKLFDHFRNWAATLNQLELFPA